MPIEFSTSLEHDLLYARWSGAVNYDQFQANFVRYLQDANYRAGRPELIDLAAVTSIDINFNLVRSMVRQVNEQAPGKIVNTRSIIYAPDETAFGIGRMYQTLAEISGGTQVEVFRTEREAMDALELPHESIAHLLRVETFLPATPAKV
ncbi:hypothetical protein [Gymnodinialimonas ulvae]|uniref:hypothetical protein n=1 Tax=Gymnodinialimonas ulvae TaxID=3126504 RepID=UPI0030B4321D